MAVPWIPQSVFICVHLWLKNPVTSSFRFLEIVHVGLVHDAVAAGGRILAREIPVAGVVGQRVVQVLDRLEDDLDLALPAVEFPAEARGGFLAQRAGATSGGGVEQTIVRDAKARGVRELPLGDFQNIVGQGVRGSYSGGQALLGRRELLESGPLAGWAAKLPPASAELSEVWIVGRDMIGRVLLRDQIRLESKAVLAELKAMGIRTVMLTGDRRQAAESVARELGLDEVRAHLTPEMKVAAIQDLRARSCAA